MSETTIKLHDDTKMELDKFKEYGNETYDAVVRKVIYIARMSKEKPQLSKEAIDAIEKARSRMKQGKYLTSDQARKRLGL